MGMKKDKRIIAYSAQYNGEILRVTAPRGSTPVNIQKNGQFTRVWMDTSRDSRIESHTYLVYGTGANRSIPPEVQLEDFVGTFHTKDGRVHMFKAFNP